MAWTQADIDRLKRAIASGTKSVQLDGSRRDFHSPGEMLNLLAVMEREVNGAPRTTVAATNKGFG